ncbi:MAG: alpha/beta hydrolase [Candidatus Daviesbacteria bacterium]|nr:alpha/beta hydrolase [Candidatus Daviesbacteria bacterium]
MAGQYFQSFDGAKIYYHKTVRDKDKWLVFLHGFGGDLTAWKKERTYFTKLGISTIAMDLRGHGLSERSNNEDFYKLENFSKDVATLLEKETIANPIIIGHCFGGMVAIYFQAQFPKVSRGLVLVDTSFKPPFFSYNPMEQTFFKQIINLILKFMPDIKTSGHVNFNKFKGSSDLDAKRILSDILHTSLRSYLLMCDNLVGLNAKQLLDKITVPTLVIEGTEDSIFPPDIAQFLSERIKNSELDLIKKANHIIVINNPADLEKSIENFLKKISFI